MANSVQGFSPTPTLYRAEVLDNEDPDRYFRVKLKIFGVNDEGTTKDTAVWAEVMQGTTPGLNTGIGICDVLKVGTMVWCLLENNDPNKPVVIGVLTGKGDESDALAGTKYLHARSLYTSSGHKIVIDDSEGDEFIYVYHRTGTFMKIDHNGDIFVNGVRDCQFDIARDVTWNIGRHLTVNVEGDEATTITGTSTWDVTGDRACSFHANRTTTVEGNDDFTVNGNRTMTIQGTNGDTVNSDHNANYNASATINVGSALSVTAGSTTVKSNGVSVNSPNTSFSGNVAVGGNMNCGGGRSRSGGTGTFTGTIIAQNDCIGGGKSLKGHTHGVINHSTTTPPN